MTAAITRGAVLLTSLAVACARSGRPADADQHVARQIIRDRHCGVCHEIPAVVGAHGVVGPSLRAFSRRTFIAGRIPNNRQNLRLWLSNPRALDDGTAMPALGMNAEETGDVAAYLESLR